MADLTPDELALARAIDCIVMVNPDRIARARAGASDSGYVGIPWGRFVRLVDALEEARPGWLERTRALMAEQGNATPWRRTAGRRNH